MEKNWKIMNMVNKTFGSAYRVEERLSDLVCSILCGCHAQQETSELNANNWFRGIFRCSFISISSNHLVGNSLQVPKIKMRLLLNKYFSIFCIFRCIFFFSVFVVCCSIYLLLGLLPRNNIKHNVHIVI